MNISTPKERVLCALNLEKPDRIPVDLGSANTTSMHCKAYENLRKKLNIKTSTTMYKKSTIMHNYQICEIEEEVLLKLGVDTRGVHSTPPHDVKKEIIDERTYISSMGVKWHMPKDGLYFDMTEFPLSGKSIEYLEEFEFPKPKDPDLFKGIEGRAKKLHKENKYAIVGDMIETGFFEPSWYLTGFTEFLRNLTIRKDFAQKLMRKTLNYQWARYEYFLDKVGEYLDVVFVGDDLATSQGPIVSPTVYREMLKPYQKEYFKKIKSRTDAKLMYHTDGNIIPILNDLIEIGVDILNPVQVSAMNTKKLKEKFGDKLCFWGAIDTGKVLPKGTPQDVELEVRKRIEDLGPEGYVINAVHNIQPDVTPENILTMFEAAKKYGKILG